MKAWAFKEHWNIVLPGNYKSSLLYATKQWIAAAQKACHDHGFFAVALSGGSTPLQIYQLLTSKTYRNEIPWEKIVLFWSDERSVSPDHADSNFRMSMNEGGFGDMPIKKENIFRMHAERELGTQALVYEKNIESLLKKSSFDLIMLGMGNDGHTASLFPHTEALHSNKRLVIPNYVPHLNASRMTLTFNCINQAKETHVYIFGTAKAAIVQKVFLSPYQPEEYPIQRIGTPEHRATLILDDEAASLIISHL